MRHVHLEESVSSLTLKLRYGAVHKKRNFQMRRDPGYPPAQVSEILSTIEIAQARYV